MTTKTISLETDAYNILSKEKRGRETFSQLVRRLATERRILAVGGIVPALTGEELEKALAPFEGIGAGPKVKPRNGKRRHAFA